MTEKELTEEEQRQILYQAGWIAAPVPPLGSGGGARVFKVQKMALVVQLQQQLFTARIASDIESQRKASASVLQFVAEAVENSGFGFLAGKVAKKPDHRLKREIEILRDVPHPNLIRMIAYDSSAEPSWYVMPVMRGGTVEDSPIFNFKGDVPGVVRGMWQIACALGALHGKGIVHRDIKPKNIFLMPTGDWILGDPGVAYRDDEADETNTRPFSKDWVPRWYDDEYNHTPKADLYMLGATAISVLVGGDKPLGANYLTKPKFDLPSLFPKAPGVDRVYALIRKLVVDEPAEIPYRDASELIPVLEALRPVVEKDATLEVSEELDRLRRIPRLVFSFTNTYSSMVSGDHEGLKRVLIWIPEDADRLVFWARGESRSWGIALFDSAYHQGKVTLDNLVNDTPTEMKLPADVRGTFVRLTVTGKSAQLHSMMVWAEHGTPSQLVR